MPTSLSRWSFRSVERGLFLLLLGLHLLPVWAFRYFASTDGPAHLYNAWVLKALLLDPESRFRTLLAFNLNPEPNYLSHALLAGLLTVLPPWLAEKAVLTLYVAGLLLAVRYLLRSWQPAAGFLAVLAFPLIYSVVLQWGFYNFCLSMVVLLLALGYWRRHLAGTAKPSIGHIAGLMGLVTLVYLAHPLAYLTAGLLLGLLLIEQLLTAPSLGRSWRARITAQVGTVALAFLPTLPLLGWYFWRKGGEGNGAAAPLGIAHYAGDLLQLEPLRYMGPAERPYRVLVAGVLLLALAYAAWRHWRGRALAPAWAWAAGGALLAVGYLLVPDALAGGSIIRPRLGLLCYLVAVGALATVAYAPAMRWVLLVSGFGVATVVVGFRFGRYQLLQAGLDEYRSAAAYIRPGSTLAPLQFARTPPMPDSQEPGSTIDAFGHTAGYLAVERNLVDYENYEAQTGYFPLTWRAGQERLAQRDSLPQRPDVRPRPGSVAPDYVLAWGEADTTAQPSPSRRRALAQLDSFYRPVFRSRTGLARLYVRRSLPVAAVAP